jgi:hypothetical protein
MDLVFNGLELVQILADEDLASGFAVQSHGGDQAH